MTVHDNLTNSFVLFDASPMKMHGRDEGWEGGENALVFFEKKNKQKKTSKNKSFIHMLDSCFL